MRSWMSLVKDEALLSLIRQETSRMVGSKPSVAAAQMGPSPEEDALGAASPARKEEGPGLSVDVHRAVKNWNQGAVPLGRVYPTSP